MYFATNCMTMHYIGLFQSSYFQTGRTNKNLSTQVYKRNRGKQTPEKKAEDKIKNTADKKRSRGKRTHEEIENDKIKNKAEQQNKVILTPRKLSCSRFFQSILL